MSTSRPSSTAAGAGMVAPGRASQRSLKRAKPTPEKVHNPSFEFIPSDPSGALPAESRKVIRSHVMRGKNTRAQRSSASQAGASAGGRTTTTRRRQPLDHIGSDQHVSGWLPDDSDNATSAVSSSSTVSTRVGQRSPFVRPSSWAYVRQDNGPGVYVTFPWAYPIPVKLPHELFRLPFPETLGPEAINIAYCFFTGIKETMYPVELCFQPDTSHICWFQWFLSDTAYFYSALFTMSALRDVVVQSVPSSPTGPAPRRSGFSPKTARYLRRTIKQLNERINDPERRSGDLTIAIIASLALVADFTGDRAASQEHVDGLSRIARSRGGVRSFVKNHSVLVKLFRVDVGHALNYGGTPVLFLQDVCWDPTVESMIRNEMGIRPDPACESVSDLMDGVDYKLRGVFSDLRAFATVADTLIASENKLRPELFQEIMMSTAHRLLLISYPAEDQMAQEALRLGLLTFQSSVFLQMNNAKTKYDFMGAQLGDIILRLPENTPVLAHLKLWLAFMGSVAIFESGEDWILDTIRRLSEGLSWPDVEKLLSRFLWIRAVHDASGRQVYDAARVERDGLSLGRHRFWTEMLGVA